MTNPFEFTPAQNLIAGLRAPGPKWWGRRLWPGYQLPYCDANLTRVLDTTEVGGLATTPAFEEHHHTAPVGLPEGQVPWKASWTAADGMPLQAADPAKPITVRKLERAWVDGRLVNTGRIERTVEVAGPVAGYLWVQGNPQPTLQLQGWNDAHARLINPDGSSTEMIGVLPRNAWGRTDYVDCTGFGLFDPDGLLVEGVPPTAWKGGRTSALMLGRNEAPHRLALVVPGLTDDESNLHEIGLWVALPHSAIPWDDLTPDGHRLARMLCSFGAITTDHGRYSAIESVSGADWQGVDWGGWAPSLGDFRVVTRA